MPRATSRCYLCGGLATTKDHVPPKSLFPSPRPNNLITLPCCEVCNVSHSEDEEYFRNNISMISDYRNARHVWEAVRRSYKRRPKILENILRRMAPGPIEDQELTQLQFEKKRTNPVVIKIAKGLLFHHTGLILPGAVAAKVVLADELQGVETLVPHLPYKRRWGETFCYVGSAAKDDPNVSFWILVFYASRVFLVSFGL